MLNGNCLELVEEDKVRPVVFVVCMKTVNLQDIH